MSTAVASIVLPSSESTEHPRLCNACHRAPTTSSSYSTCPICKVDTPKDNSPPSPDIEFSKFQFAKDLHRDINQRYPDYSNSIRFQGTYAIVAFPDIDNKQRARQVARDLRASTDLHFDLEDRLKSHRSHDASKAYTITYQCACRASAPTLKRNPSDLTAWLGSKKTGASDDKVKECRGRIEISAEDDTSHPFVLGQRVKVIVTHPKRAY
ncbi:hypothetical protein B0H10DRAFT_2044745 [Mycena sp. CBHHK59/15]|nr:hypothetical protein B0H10DRAFT_2044745 [Mycena sp. CBHHK59/15]